MRQALRGRRAKIAALVVAAALAAAAARRLGGGLVEQERDDKPGPGDAEELAAVRLPGPGRDLEQLVPFDFDREFVEGVHLAPPFIAFAAFSTAATIRW
jgi:hypothetical protein